MKLTGERPIEGSTPDSLIALHDAGYREIAARLGPGTVVDIGCGYADETVKLCAPDRVVVGVDYDPATAIDARRARSALVHGIDPARLQLAAMDGARLALRAASADAVCSSHIIEHFVAPERHVVEIARLLAPEGTAFVVTPNAPADFENPFHVYLFEPAQLRSLLELFFDDVEVLGLEGSPALKEDFARRRASGSRLLRLDPLELRHRVPRSWYRFAYERILPIAYRALGSETTGIGSGIDETHFFTTDDIQVDTPVLFAIARGARRRAHG